MAGLHLVPYSGKITLEFPEHESNLKLEVANGSVPCADIVQEVLLPGVKSNLVDPESKTVSDKIRICAAVNSFHILFICHTQFPIRCVLQVVYNECTLGLDLSEKRGDCLVCQSFLAAF